MSKWYGNTDGWTPFDIKLENQQPLPPERKDVIVKMASFENGLPEMLAVGFLRYAAGDERSPQFIIPGVPQFATVIAWKDGLKND